MTFKLACGDVMPGCAAHFENPDKNALLADVASHAASVHGITDLTPEIFAAVDSKIYAVAA